MSDLTPMQKKFADAYISTLNGVKSAEIAGYKGGYHQLGVQAHQNLKKPKIRQYVNERLETFVMPANEILARLSEQAAGNIGIFFEIGDDGTLIPDADAIAKNGGALKAIRETKDGLSITMYDGQAALIALGKHYALFIDKFEGEVKNMPGAADIIAAIQAAKKQESK